MKILSANKILNLSSLESPKDGFSFVYFLISGSEIIYVGQTKHLSDRLTCHSLSGKVFDRHVKIEVSDNYVDVIESCYIHSLKPSMNGNLNTGDSKNSPEKSAPLTISKISNMLCDFVDFDMEKN